MKASVPVARRRTDALARGTLKAGDKNFTADGKTYEIAGDNVMLGKPFVFSQGNIDQFDF